ncbi:hypothetical protein [Actinoplanes friuliensis]|jgi:hypothetical protein|uniref:Uncharacterized protein n=1 Tax=Actinoplanes friuliensis DSM 7358 TaxID=1246995 RepID=U5W4L5_9ACTN|nr:hypothetical protein [Actinoplanes friuliensis]AGZ42940.1 hypothetical protein AFR_23350 [Actinoplanes friuliensis DSM 7358]
MIALPILLLAAVIGVFLAAADGPYEHDKVRLERVSVVLIAAAAVIAAAGVVVVVRDWVPG